MSLGIKQVVPDPWPKIIKKYTIGTALECLITKITNFGFFVEIEKDLEGLIHISESGIEASDKLEDHYKVGDKVEAVVVKMDEVEKKIGLSLKKKQG